MGGFPKTLLKHTHTRHTIETRFSINPQINNRADGRSLCDITRDAFKHDNDNSQNYDKLLQNFYQYCMTLDNW